MLALLVAAPSFMRRVDPAATLKPADGELVSSAREAVEGLLAVVRAKTEFGGNVGGFIPQRVIDFERGVLSRLNALSLPPSAIDALISYFGPSNVAEMTGRSKRLLPAANGSGFVYASRAEKGVSLANVNLVERARFQRGPR